MEAWFILIVSLCLSALLPLLVSLRSSSLITNQKLPPGPFYIPIISSILWLRRSASGPEPFLRSLHVKYGPIITLHINSHPAIFIADRSLAHQALVQNGAFFSDRPKSLPLAKIINSNQHSINSAFYGPTWRVLRRNLISEMLQPSRIGSFSGARKWVLDDLLDRLKSNSESYHAISVIDHFQYAMFCLLVFMCFGERIGDEQIKNVEDVQRGLLLGFRRFNVLNFWPGITRMLFRKRWNEFLKLWEDRQAVLAHLIRARKTAKEHRLSNVGENNHSNIDEFVFSYVDSLLDLELPEDKRKLSEDEMISLCSEFLNAGTDTTSTALQWIMANLVKYPHVQQNLVKEIRDVIGDIKKVKEEDLEKMPYLKAVVLEGLRRHPPGHFLLPHSVTKDVILNGYLLPKNGTVNFMVAEIGWDPKVWEDPLAFKPERFLDGERSEAVDFDVTGSKEIKMMPFGAGRRICPGYNLALLHLEYFVANLVWNFEWTACDGVEVDLSEKQEFTTVMKNPLKASISLRV